MIISKIKKIYINNKEAILYLIFGVTTTLVNLLVFHIFLWLSFEYKLANLCAIILGKLYAYLTNKIWVFKSKTCSIGEFFKEFFKFICARGTTGIIDYFGLIVAVEIFHANQIIAKYVLQIIVILLNYFFSKFIVFSKKKKE